MKYYTADSVTEASGTEASLKDRWGEQNLVITQIKLHKFQLASECQ